MPTDPGIKRGDKVTVQRLGGAPVRVMAVADGYAMLRRPGCIPFVEPLKNLTKAGRDAD